MKLHDKLAGILILVLGTVVAAMALSFPAMPGQSIGPSAFPAVLGVGLIVGGLVLCLSRSPATAWVALDPGLRESRSAMASGAVVVGLIGYALTVQTLGFFLSSALLLALLFRAFGVPLRWLVTLTIIVPIVLHYGFYSVLRVPLPWGLLEGVAW